VGLAAVLALVGCGRQNSVLIDDTAGSEAAVSSSTSAEADSSTTPLTAEPTPEPTPVPDIVARVGDKTITKRDFERELVRRVHQIESQSGKQVDLNDQFRALIVQYLIDGEILSMLADQSGVTVSDEEVGQDFERSRQAMGGDDALNAYLDRESLTVEQLKELIRRRLMTGKFMDKLAEGLTIPEDELQAKYDEYAKLDHLNREEDTTDVAHLLIKVASGADEAAWNEARTQIDQARARIAGGEDFAAVANEVSQDQGSARRGGLYREVPKGKMVPEFETVMNETAVGALSDPFKTDYGWHILTVKARHKAGTMTFEEVHEDLASRLLLDKKREMFSQMAKEGRKQFPIEALYLPELVFPPEDEADDGIPEVEAVAAPVATPNPAQPASPSATEPPQTAPATE